jgi:hypothetical protein
MLCMLVGVLDSGFGIRVRGQERRIGWALAHHERHPRSDQRFGQRLEDER